MLYNKDSQEYILKRTDNLQAVRPFSDPAFPFTITSLQMSKLPSPYIPWHWHDDIEILWVESGTLIAGTTEDSIYVHANEALFINTNVLHTLQTSGGTDCEFYSIRFLARMLFPQSNSTLANAYMHPVLLSQSIKQIHFVKSTPAFAQSLQLIQELIQIYFGDTACMELHIFSRLFTLWSQISEYIHETHPTKELTKPVMVDYARIIDAIHYIADYYADPITLEDIADAIHISKSECCRCFKRSIGSSPIEYLIQYRIMAAIRKMQTRDPDADSISGLAISVGFNSPSYFNKQFKRYINCTPLEYRKKLLSANHDVALEEELLNKLKSLDL